MAKKEEKPVRIGFHTTIKARLVTFRLLVSLVPTVTAGIVFLAYDLTVERGRLIKGLNDIGEKLALDCRAPLTVRDQAKLAKNLAGLEAKPPILATSIYAKDNSSPVAACEKPGIKVSRPTSARGDNSAFSFPGGLAFAVDKQGFDELLDHVRMLDASIESKGERLKHELAAQASVFAKAKKCLDQTMLEFKRLKDAAAGANEQARGRVAAGVSSTDNGRGRSAFGALR